MSTSQATTILALAISLATDRAEPQLEQLRELLPGLEIDTLHTARIGAAHHGTFVAFARGAQVVLLDAAPMMAESRYKSVTLRVLYSGPIGDDERIEIQEAVDRRNAARVRRVG